MLQPRDLTSERTFADGSPSPPQRQDIQGLRGAAVLLVVLFHAGTFVRGGFVGVDVFFVISGFVITSSLLRELARSGTISLSAFYARRVRRLLPALGLLTFVVLLLSTLELDPAGGRQALADTARAASLFAANLHLQDVGGGYFSPDAERNPLLHTWSLSIEEQFYAFLPLLVVGAWALGRRRSVRPLQLLIYAMTALSFTWAAYTVAGGDERAAFYLPHLRAWEFCAGAVLALNLPSVRRIGSTAASLLIATGLAIVVGAGVGLSAATTFPGPIALLPVAGTTMIIAGGTARPSHWFGMRSRWLGWLGDRSYSWYLWHWPALTFAFMRWPQAGWIRITAAIAALGPAAVSYAWVERPVRVNPRIVGSAALGVALLCIVAPAVTAVAVKRAADQEVAQRAPELSELTAVWRSGCDELPWPSERCTFGPADAGGTMVLLGDSHASALADMVIHVGAQLGLRTMAFTKAGCGASLAPLPKDTSGCRSWLTASLDRIRTIEPAVVVVASRSPLYVLGRVGVDPSGRQPIAAQPEEAFALWSEGLRALFAELDAPALLLQAAPEQPASVVNLMGRDVTDAQVPELPMADHRRRTGGINDVERRLVHDLDEVLLVDPADFLCSAQGCPARVDGKWRYFDASHLTPAATLLLADEVRARLRQLLS